MQNVQKTTFNGIEGVRLSEARSEALMSFLRGQGMLVLPDGDMLIYWDDWMRFVEEQDWLDMPSPDPDQER